MVFLPESFDFLEPAKDKVYDKTETLNGNLIGAYRDIARSRKIWLSLGGLHRRVRLLLNFLENQPTIKSICLKGWRSRAKSFQLTHCNRRQWRYKTSLWQTALVRGLFEKRKYGHEGIGIYRTRPAVQYATGHTSWSGRQFNSNLFPIYVYFLKDHLTNLIQKLKVLWPEISAAKYTIA